VVSGYSTGYWYTGGVKNGRERDFIDENINKEQSIEVPPPEVEADLVYPEFPHVYWSQSLRKIYSSTS
jgi:hypothetical protein